MVEVHYHCVYVEQNQCFTFTAKADGAVIFQQDLTPRALMDTVRSMKGARDKIEIAGWKVHMPSSKIAKLREYLELILASYEKWCDQKNLEPYPRIPPR